MPSRETLLVLAVDTTTRAGGVAVLRGGTVLAALTGDPAITHGQRLPGDLQRALDAAGVALDEVSLLAVAAGPGSFTGLRVGIAAIQGVAFSRGLKVVPVSTLEALAREAAAAAPTDARPIAPWMDARRGQVFAALYAADGRTVLHAPSSLLPADTLARWRETIGCGEVTFVGDGAWRYRATIEGTLPAARILGPPLPLAPAVGRIAAQEPERAVLPHAIVPVYVRRPDAELAREERGA